MPAIDHALDLLEAFYGADFATPFTRRRPGHADAPVMLIPGETDEAALNARVIAAQRTAHYAAGADVSAGDLLVAQRDAAPDVPAGTALRVLEPPRRVVDGREMEALLGSALA